MSGLIDKGKDFIGYSTNKFFLNPNHSFMI